MLPEKLVKTIYLGDRACKKIIFDIWNEEVRVEIDEISRVRSKSGNWEYYNEENIVDCQIVFTEIKTFFIENNGFLPNDSINYLKVFNPDDGTIYEFLFSINSQDEMGDYHETFLKVKAKGMHLFDPKKPEEKIY